MKESLVTDFDSYVGMRLRSLRQGHGESQQALGKKCAITFQQIQKYEKGTNHLSLSRAYEIAGIYNVPLTYFTDGFETAAINDGYHDALPLFDRASMQAAKLYNDLGNSRIQKAILGLLNMLATEKNK